MESVPHSTVNKVISPDTTIGTGARITTNWRGIALVMLSAFCFSSGIIFTRMTTGLSPLQIAFFRAFFAFLFFCCLLPKYPQALYLNTYRNSILRLIGLGMAVTATSALFVYAVQNTTAANASLLINSAPIYVALLAPLFLKERRSRIVWFGVSLAIGGTVMLSNPSQLGFDLRSWSGILAGILSGFTFALVMLLSRSLKDRVNGHTQVLWSSAIASLVLLPWALQTDAPVVMSNLEFLVPLGVIALGAAYFFSFLGLKRVPAQVASVTALSEPVSSIFIGLLLFHEPLGLLSVVGAVLVLASIYLISR